MITGWDRGFIIEKETNKYTKKFSCSLCDYYDPSDKSCNKKYVFLPEVGYDMWKTCGGISYTPNGKYSEEHISQLIKAGKTFGIQHISMKDFPEDVFYEKIGGSFNYWKIKDEYLALFSKIYYENSVNSVEKACILVPEEFLEKYKEAVLSLQFEPFYEVIGAFINIIGCRAGGQTIRNLARFFHSSYMNKMFSKSIEEITLYSISKEFVISFSRWLGKRNCYNKIKEFQINGNIINNVNDN